MIREKFSLFLLVLTATRYKKVLYLCTQVINKIIFFSKNIDTQKIKKETKAQIRLYPLHCVVSSCLIVLQIFTIPIFVLFASMCISRGL